MHRISHIQIVAGGIQHLLDGISDVDREVGGVLHILRHHAGAFGQIVDRIADVGRHLLAVCDLLFGVRCSAVHSSRVLDDLL